MLFYSSIYFWPWLFSVTNQFVSHMMDLEKNPHQFKLDIESKFKVETSITIRMRIVMINSMTKTKTWQWKELWWRTNIRSFDFVSWKNSNCNCKFWVESYIFTMSVCVSLRPRDIFLLRNNFLLFFLHFLFLCRLNIVLPFLLCFSSPLRTEYIPSPIFSSLSFSVFLLLDADQIFSSSKCSPPMTEKNSLIKFKDLGRLSRICMVYFV